MQEHLILKVRDLKKWFSARKDFLVSFFSKNPEYIKAVDGIDFGIRRGEVFGLVGESGCGKTTTGRLLLRLIEPTSGQVFFKDANIFSLNKTELKKFRCEVQMVFQDPYEYLSPRTKVFDIVAEPLVIHKKHGREEKANEVLQTLESVGLTPPESFTKRYPHELSGGQRQRVAIARAIVLRPKFLVADEPVSMLDVSIRAGVLNLMLDLKEKFNLAYLFITHDFSSARYMCNRIAVMYLGKIVEIGKTEQITNETLHPYSRTLMSTILTIDPKIRISDIPTSEGIISVAPSPSGCRFYPRCKYAKEKCRKDEPKLVEVSRGHFVACHFIDS